MQPVSACLGDMYCKIIRNVIIITKICHSKEARHRGCTVEKLFRWQPEAHIWNQMVRTQALKSGGHLPVPRFQFRVKLHCNDTCRLHFLAHVPPCSVPAPGSAYHCSFGTTTSFSGCMTKLGDMIWTPYSLNTSWIWP